MKKTNCIGLFGALLLLAGVVPALAEADAAPTNRTVITANRLTFDYERRTAVFEENVVVTDPSITIESDRLNVVFDRENGVESVTAVGNVRMRYGARTGTCRKAIYLAKEGQLLMLGDAELKRGQDSVKGERILFWIAEDRMTCEPGSLVIYNMGGQAPILPGLGAERDEADATKERR